MRISKNKFLQLKKYFVKKVAKKEEVFIIEGRKGVEEVLQSNYEIQGVYLLSDYIKDSKYQKILDLLKEQNIEWSTLYDRDAEQLSALTSSPGILAVVKRKNEMPDLQGPILVLDQINNPGNLGTILRTALWFGINNIILSEGSVSKYNAKVVRSSMGAFFHLNIIENVYLPKFLLKQKESGYVVLAADVNKSTVKLSELKNIIQEKTIYLFGNESHGLAENLEEFIDDYYMIKKIGKGESLNLAVSVGVVLSQLYLE